MPFTYQEGHDINLSCSGAYGGGHMQTAHDGVVLHRRKTLCCGNASHGIAHISLYQKVNHANRIM